MGLVLVGGQLGCLVGCQLGLEERDGAEMGKPCVADEDCKSGLCLLESAVLFSEGGPPGGICSGDCSEEDNCPADTVCTPTSVGSRCLFGCEFGEDADKCGGRSAYACEPLYFASGAACETIDDCESGEECAASDDGTSVCSLLLGICTPRCGSDADCSEGRSCDLGSGECVEGAAEGSLRSGEACEPSDDRCRGVCTTFADESSACVEYCRLGAERGCGEDTLSEFACETPAYPDLGWEQGAGDTGICSAK